MGLLQSVLMPLKIRTVKNGMQVPQKQKTKTELLPDPAVLLCVFIQKHCHQDLEMFTLQCSFISALFLNSHTRWEQPKWMNEQRQCGVWIRWVVSQLKQGASPQDITLSEIRQS